MQKNSTNKLIFTRMLVGAMCYALFSFSPSVVLEADRSFFSAAYDRIFPFVGANPCKKYD